MFRVSSREMSGGSPVPSSHAVLDTLRRSRRAFIIPANRVVIIRRCKSKARTTTTARLGPAGCIAGASFGYPGPDSRS
ncbi:hypothetical protein MRX96_056138 [Rhipicephalus microplus]